MPLNCHCKNRGCHLSKHKIFTLILLNSRHICSLDSLIKFTCNNLYSLNIRLKLQLYQNWKFLSIFIFIFLVLSLMLQMASNYLRPTLVGGPGFKFLGINLNSLAAKQIVYLSWTLPWTIACILVLQIMSSPFQLFFFFGFKPIDFLSKMATCTFSLNLLLFDIGPLSKGYGSNLWLLSNKIALFRWTLDSHLKRP
jgi:hypothetical protein